jgi:hypothetical protein
MAPLCPPIHFTQPLSRLVLGMQMPQAHHNASIPCKLAQPLDRMKCKVAGVDSILPVTEWVLLSFVFVSRRTLTGGTWTQTRLVSNPVTKTIVHPIALPLSPPYISVQRSDTNESRPHGF